MQFDRPLLKVGLESIVIGYLHASFKLILFNVWLKLKKDKTNYNQKNYQNTSISLEIISLMSSQCKM